MTFSAVKAQISSTPSRNIPRRMYGRLVSNPFNNLMSKPLLAALNMNLRCSSEVHGTDFTSFLDGETTQYESVSNVGSCFRFVRDWERFVIAHLYHLNSFIFKWCLTHSRLCDWLLLLLIYASKTEHTPTSRLKSLHSDSVYRSVQFSVEYRRGV